MMDDARAAKDARAVDAFGLALGDWVRGGRVPEIIERDDGYYEEGAGPEVYLSPFSRWPRAERRALGEVRGRVLDLGCGAGRVALELQSRGLRVVGLDASKRAIRAARERGVTSLWHCTLEELGDRFGEFDSVVLFGNNFGLFATPDAARGQLTSWARCARPGVRLLIESTNAYGGGAPGVDRAYYRSNRAAGRPGGQLRARYHFEGQVGDWFTWLFVGRSELRAIVRHTGWRVAQVYGSRSDEPYVAVLELATVR